MMASLIDAEAESLRTFDWTTTHQPSLTVVETIADLKDTDPVALTPLASVIDPEALNRLIAPSTRSTATDCTITFAYEGYTLQLTPDGGTIYEAPQEERATTEAHPGIRLEWLS